MYYWTMAIGNHDLFNFPTNIKMNTKSITALAALIASIAALLTVFFPNASSVTVREVKDNEIVAAQNKIDKQKLEKEQRYAQKLAGRWFVSLKNQDAEMLSSIADTPFFIDGQLLLTIPDITKRYTDLRFFNSSSYGELKSMSNARMVRSIKATGYLNRDLKENLSNNAVNNDDFAIFIVSNTKNSVHIDDSFILFFRRTEEGVKMAGVWREGYTTAGIN